MILYNMKVSTSENCTFCQAEKDSIQHIFWKCPCIKRFWQTFQQTVNETIVNMNLSLTENIILFGCDDNFKSDSTFDLIILLAKFFIYKCKMEKINPEFQHYIHYLKRRYAIEKHVSLISLSQMNFVTRWHNYLPLFL